MRCGVQSLAMADPHVERVMVDLDGVLSLGPGRGPYDFAPVRTGARAFLDSLHEIFDEVVVFSARPVDAAKNWLRENHLLGGVNDVTQQKLPARIYIDDRGLKFMGDFASTLSDVRTFKTHWEESSNVGQKKHEYASTQVQIPPGAKDKVLAMATKIPDDILSEDGRESDPHITVLFGITEDSSIDKLRAAVAGFGRVSATLGETSTFENVGYAKDQDVLKVTVTSPDLQRLRKKIEGAVEFETDYPDYEPHCTIAYVKAGQGKRLAGDRSLVGIVLLFDTLVFSAQDNTKTELPLR